MSFFKRQMKPAIVVAVALGSFLLNSCVSYDPPPQESKPVPAKVESWRHISTNSWGSLSYSKRTEALELLANKDFVAISETRYKELSLAPDDLFPAKQIIVPSGCQLYLVKGRGYGISGGRVRFNPKTRELYVLLVAYNGEMSFPGMRWGVEDLPIVVALPASPSSIHKSAEIGGDSIYRLMDHD
ncbi:MAG: hypothetical protein RLZZ505_1652 [Verrucomicrobiota bacterium]